MSYAKPNLISVNECNSTKHEVVLLFILHNMLCAVSSSDSIILWRIIGYWFVGLKTSPTYFTRDSVNVKQACIFYLVKFDIFCVSLLLDFGWLISDFFIYITYFKCSKMLVIIYSFLFIQIFYVATTLLILLLFFAKKL